MAAETGLAEAAPERVREQLARILASKTFTGAKRSQEILRYVVEESLAGRSAGLKEYAIGAEALGRGAAFDPKADPIARVEASRLRSRLDLYNATDGALDPVVISMPKGGYAPVFTARAAAASPLPLPVPARNLAPLLAAFAAGAVLSVIALLAWPRTAPPLPAPFAAQLEFALGAEVEIANQVGNSVALSPDGQTVVFVGLGKDGGTRLYARRLDGLTATELGGTLGATGPFLSPDGRWVGFQAEGKLKKTLVDGGATPVTLGETPDFLGGSWGTDGFIIATVDRTASLWRYPENGGAPQKIAGPDSATDNPRWPQILPGGRKALITSTAGQAADTTIDIIDLATGQRTNVIPRGAYARYAAGHILFVDRGTLFSAPFDAVRLKALGDPAPVVRQVAYDFGYGFAQFAVSDSGAVVYLRDPSEGLSTVQRITSDKTAPLLATPGRYLWPRLSPKGDKLAYSSFEGSDYDLWEIDLRSGEQTRLTSAEGGQSRPVWTPDGRWLLWHEDAAPAIWARRTDNSGEAIKLISGIRMPSSVSPDGSRIAWFEIGEKSGFDLWTAPLTSDAQTLRIGEPAPFLLGATFDIYPRFSPDGRWIAYASAKSGPHEIYVRPSKGEGAEVRVSFTGGRIPAWSATPGELLYETPANRIMSVRYKVQNGVFQPETPRPWSEARLARTGMLTNFDADPSRPGIAALIPANQPADWRPDRLTLLTGYLRHLP
ncbi:MAG TPA: hypothetical protein VGO52_15160 [Hyphomonadaceae bacterium]|nr:hypothetical protein [Hyphomonadaceae bacterium]